ncbi:MAG: hypothetical protein IPG44_11680 [Anaerolineales bacterium]|nr:hypothetical protein [Anaerolineales bacterium]
MPDGLSLVSGWAGHQPSTPTDFIVGLQGFQPDLREATPNLQSLVAALDVVNARTFSAH